ncbi:MAG: ABC transporter permease [Chloroflexi bacterium]|nr:ABC transporter permease [Chloroflexota bacterium]
MLGRIVRKSISVRKHHLLIPGLALTLATTLISALLILSLEVKSKAGKELEAYGANVIVLPKGLSLPAGSGGLSFGYVTTEAYVSEQALTPIDSGQVPGIASYVPYLYTTASLGDRKVVVAGTEMNRLKQLASSWKVNGKWPDNTDLRGIIVGKEVAIKLGIAPGDNVSLKFDHGSADFTVSGVVQVGGSEDSQIMVDLNAAQILSERVGQLDIVQVRISGEGSTPESSAAKLESIIPGIEAKVISRVVGAEQRVLYKVQLLMGLVVAGVLLAAGLTVFGTMTAGVMERTKEIGLMKALGAKNSRIALIFMIESWIIALSSGVLGNALGVQVAQAVGKRVFDVNLSFHAVVIPVALAIAFAVTTLSSLWPVRSALAMKPISALKGE